jgi:hypothetical protein
MPTSNVHWTYPKNWTPCVDMETVAKRKLVEVYSKSTPERNIEMKFMRRLLECITAMKISDQSGIARLQHLVNSGEFNDAFPALFDESPVPSKRFKDLKAFDYEDWSKRNPE